MSTVVKKFNFVTDTEGWVGHVQDSQVVAEWRKPYRKYVGENSSVNRLLNPPLSLMGGCLKTIARCFTSIATENWWELTASWEELGVPVGATVTSVTAEYLYRWDQRGKASTHDSLQVWGEEEIGAGPFELRKNDESLIGTFSERQYGPNRELVDGVPSWWAWPEGKPPNPDNPLRTEYPISEIPNSWLREMGEDVNVPLELQSSNSIVKFRLKNLLPPAPARGESWRKYYVRFKNDRVVITVTYTGGVVSSLSPSLSPSVSPSLSPSVSLSISPSLSSSLSPSVSPSTSPSFSPSYSPSLSLSLSPSSSYSPSISYSISPSISPSEELVKLHIVRTKVEHFLDIQSRHRKYPR